MLILPLTENNQAEVFSEALKVLQHGGIIAYPTESFYALGVIATDEKAVKRLFELKKRPLEKPLPIIIGDACLLDSMVKNMPEQARGLMEKYWPGPLTLVFEALDSVPEVLTGGTGRIAIRIPGRSAALDLARAVNIPFTATSANPSALPPADSVDVIDEYFDEKLDLIIDDGKAPGGKPSTIVDITAVPFRVLREGGIQPDLR